MNEWMRVELTVVEVARRSNQLTTMPQTRAAFISFFQTQLRPRSSHESNSRPFLRPFDLITGESFLCHNWDTRAATFISAKMLERKWFLSRPYCIPATSHSLLLHPLLKPTNTDHSDLSRLHTVNMHFGVVQSRIDLCVLFFQQKVNSNKTRGLSCTWQDTKFMFTVSNPCTLKRMILWLRTESKTLL